MEEVPTTIKEEKDNLRELLEENIRLTKEIHAYNAKIKKYMFIRLVLGIVWIVIVLAPIILAIIWLPPFLKEFFMNYTDAFNGLTKI